MARRTSSGVRGALLLVAGLLMTFLLLSPATADVTSSFKHLWNDHIKPKIANPGTINSANNPVDWTKLKGVPSDFADGTDAGLGTITPRTGTATVQGGAGENGAYILDSVTVACNAGETAISWSAYWDGDLNGAAAGGGDDQELTIASARFDGSTQGYTVWGGNDSGTAHTLTLQVLCVAG